MNTKHSLWACARFLVLAAVLICALGTQQTVHASGPYTVNVSYDGPDSNLGDGVCYDGVSGCTLRAAVQQAQHDGVATTIYFDPSLSGIQLYLSNTYGPLVIAGSNITINGYIGASFYPPLINGSNLFGQNVIEIQGNNNTLYFLVVRSAGTHANDNYGNGIYIHDPTSSGMASYNTLNALIVYDNAHNGVLISGDSGGGGHDNLIEHSLIGGGNWGQTACSIDGNMREGIQISGGASFNTITGNTIVCNNNSGIWLNGGSGGTVTGTTISNNRIGTFANTDTGNGLAGITDTSASGTQILSNQIAGNNQDGIWLQASVNTEIYNNRIGVDGSGNAALANAYDGIYITDSANNINIGSSTDISRRNVISGNGFSGIEFFSGANNNVVSGNFIGLGFDGITPVPNGYAGAAFSNVHNNALGNAGYAPVTQFISANGREGVYIYNSELIFVSNSTYIGVAADGSTARGNALQGVMIAGTSESCSLRPGKDAFNGGAGIAVVDTATAVEIIPGNIYQNGGLAVDLGNDGHTPNDPGDGDSGPNGLLNYPVVLTKSATGFSGRTCPNCVVSFYSAYGNPTSSFGGGRWLGFLSANGSGDFAYTFPADVGSVSMITCLDTSDWSCSEMSPAVLVNGVFLPLVQR